LALPVLESVLPGPEEVSPPVEPKFTTPLIKIFKKKFRYFQAFPKFTVYCSNQVTILILI
jgi:hypothetical protein